MTPTVLLSEIKQLLSTPEPPELGPGPRAGVRSAAELNAAVDEIFARTKQPSVGIRQELVRAVVLLWHDHLEPAHVIAQREENADGSYIHAILHRREPDYGNAKYWFRRVGQHPCYREPATQVAALLQARGESVLARRLVPKGGWDAAAFVDACAAASRHSAHDPRVALLREIQKTEFDVLLDYLCRAN